MFGALRQFYASSRSTKAHISRAAVEDISIHNERIRFEVNLKVGKKYERRALEVLRRSDERGKQEWILYVVKNADYTSYEYFRLSHSFITQLFNAKDSKCTLVLVEDVLRFKMTNLSDKWRLVEFLRANIESKASTYAGSLEWSPSFKHTSSVRIFLKDTTLVILDRKTKKVIAHKTLQSFEMVVCKEREVSFVCRTDKESCEFWSVTSDNMMELAAEMSKIIKKKRLSVPFTCNRIQPRETQPVPIYTDF
ncbi:unnamed protein product [Caenorhabditis sp. 36 PRJEB53466]|nr:unnamed protein product [Caenorhabditis sp. 36 PRJEB53466]